MFNLFQKLSNKKIILISIAIFLLMVAIVVLYFFKIINETLFTILLFILLMTFSTFTSSLMQRHFQKKMDNKKKGTPYYFNGNVEFKNPLKSLKANFGKVDLYLENKVLYTLVSVNNADVFFSEEQQQVKYNVDKKKYDRLIQFYVFDVKDYNLFRKISILNYQSQNFYVGSFIVDKAEKIIYQADNVKPNEEYQPIYENFIKLLNLDQK